MNLSDFNYEEFKEKLTLVKSTIDPEFLLSNIGFSSLKVNSSEIRCSCPIHGGDNKSAFRLNKSTNTWVCFTHKCHSDVGNDLIGLVRAKLGLSFKEAADYLLDLAGLSDETFKKDYAKFKVSKNKDNFIRVLSEGEVDNDIVSENALEYFLKFRSTFFNKAGFSKETLDFFEIGGGFIDEYGNERDVIPIRDYKGLLKGYSLRDVSDNYNEDTKYLITAGLVKDKLIYNLHNTLKLKSDKPLILVEGFKSVWRLHSLGITNVAALMGSVVTEGQYSLLLSFATKGVVLFLDNDIPGQEGTLSSIKLINNKIPVIPVYIQESLKSGKGCDPDELTDEAIISYLEDYV